MKRGFTLVELSIVLVIIGLLIGGILVAQSMVGTSKIASTVSQIQQFDAGSASFFARYNKLPGDAPALGGDGDGMITRTVQTFTNKDINLVQCEMATYFYNMAPDQYTALSCTALGYYFRNQMQTSHPKTKIGIKDGFWLASAVGGVAPTWAPNTTNPINYYVMLSPYNYPSCFNCDDFGQGAYNVMHSVTSGNRTVSPTDLLALDKKLDDGIANTGFVIAGGIHWANAGIAPTELATCSVAGIYQVTNKGYECTPMIEIGVASGVNR